MSRKPKLTTLVITVTVRRRDSETAKDSLVESLAGDFDAVFSTEEREPTKEEIDAFKAGEFI
jgi:hypothetical protein